MGADTVPFNQGAEGNPLMLEINGYDTAKMLVRHAGKRRMAQASNTPRNFHSQPSSFPFPTLIGDRKRHVTRKLSSVNTDVCPHPLLLLDDEQSRLLLFSDGVLYLLQAAGSAVHLTLVAKHRHLSLKNGVDFRLLVLMPVHICS